MKKSFFKGNKLLAFIILALAVFGSLMIISAEMGESVGDSNYLFFAGIKQLAFLGIGLFCYQLVSRWDLKRFRIFFFYAAYLGILFMLLICRFFSETNGAYAWIRIGSITIQPSEFAKAFMILTGAKFFSTDHKENNIKFFETYAAMAILYVFIILFIQNDLGSAVILAIISYCILLMSSYKETKIYQKYMIIFMLVVVVVFIVSLTPFVTNILKKHYTDYRVARFLASADPFLYQYDSGYHLIMSLVSFANGGIFGLGYGNSIHKYMNFPNPSNDFILPVIVEELGIVGFIGLILIYFFIIFCLIYYSIKSRNQASKIIFLGTFLYFVCHFILNVGGVGGFIPLTGVPLLLVSSGGSSWVSSLVCLGLCQFEIERYKNESSSRNL